MQLGFSATQLIFRQRRGWGWVFVNPLDVIVTQEIFSCDLKKKAYFNPFIFYHGWYKRSILIKQNDGALKRLVLNLSANASDCLGLSEGDWVLHVTSGVNHQLYPAILYLFFLDGDTVFHEITKSVMVWFRFSSIHKSGIDMMQHHTPI